MKIEDILQPQNIILDCHAQTKKDTIYELSKCLYHNSCIQNIEAFLNDIYIREDMGFTGVGRGIAIPHGVSGQVRHVAIAAARLSHEVEWTTKEEMNEKDKKMKLVILFAVPDSDVYKEEREHINALKIIMRCLANEDNLKKLMCAANETKFIQVFKEDKKYNT